MAKMFLMCGHPGSGKSTYARELARKNGYRYLSIDDMYATFNGDPTSHDNKFDVWMTFFRQIHAAEIAGHDIVVDTNAPTRGDREEFLNWFSDFEHHLIWIDAPKELCLRNNQNRSRVIPEDHMKRIFNFFDRISSDEWYNYAATRSRWVSISRVENCENKFMPRHIMFGSFPKDVIE